jgi:uncharacterized protein (UPF0335 family)
MATSNDVTELMERYFQIENEIKLLQEDRKELLAEFKDRIDPKAFKAALQAVKIQARLKPDEKPDFDVAYEILGREMNIEHID